MNWTALAVFSFFFLLITFLGFRASHWRRGNLNLLDEWGLGGRRFGTVVTWFLLGGDLYTAYTFIAVPALMFGKGAIGFFALPYTIIIYPFVFMVFPRLWAVSHKHGFVTSADFVHARYGSKYLALAIAVTGIVATMPYIALQLVGIQVVIGALGFNTTGLTGDLPLIIAFGILAAYTYSSGLRAPAMIAIVKDLLIYITILTAIFYIPARLGGYAHIFSAIPIDKLLLKGPSGGSLNGFSAYSTLALGSALALFLYPHSITAVLSANSGNTIRRNTALLPAYSLLLGLIALLGYMAVAAGVSKLPEYGIYFKQYGSNFAVPALFLHLLPPWFTGFAFAAIAIGALVPAAIMSIAAANLYTRNIHRPFINPGCNGKHETRMAKNISLLVKLGALAFIIFLPQQYAIQLQLLGGIWIIQTLPAIIFGLYSHWLDYRALLAGWAIGLFTGTGMAASLHFKSSIYPLHVGSLTFPVYAALYSLIINIITVVFLTYLVRKLRLKPGKDQTQDSDYNDADRIEKGGEFSEIV
ncbi:MAG: sodium:solute symporter [Pseudomonadota bacterium]|nr:sodium:solute symporter [Pseudomonadota bacterium]